MTLKGLQQFQRWGRQGCGAGGLPVAISREHKGQRLEGELGSRGRALVRAPQTHGALTFKEQCEIAFRGLRTCRADAVWRGCLSDNLRQDRRHPGQVPPTCSFVVISRNSLDLQLLRRCHSVITGTTSPHLLPLQGKMALKVTSRL